MTFVIKTEKRIKIKKKHLLNSLLTPSKQIIPHEMLFFCKHRHNNQSVQVDAFAKHPEVVAAQQIQVDEH